MNVQDPPRPQPIIVVTHEALRAEIETFLQRTKEFLEVDSNAELFQN